MTVPLDHINSRDKQAEWQGDSDRDSEQWGYGVTPQVPDPRVLASRIHSGNFVWQWTFEGDDALSQIRARDSSAYDQLWALVRYAWTKGLPPTDNNNNPNRTGSPTHRCPVGKDVQHLAEHGFDDDDKPMPWTGELSAESHDQRSQHRIYFIEARPQWNAPTDTVLGCGGSTKPAIPQSDDHLKQTLAIRDAMHSGINWCINRPSKWRKWDEP